MTNLYTLLIKASRTIARLPLGVLAASVFILQGSTACHGFDISAYASDSRLSQGRWMKIGIERSGVYMISNSTLRSWGFNDPSRVRIYGYGGLRLPDLLSLANYTDDLPMVQTVQTQRGIVFYGVGAGEWTGTNNYYHYDPNIYTSEGYYYVTETSGAAADPLREFEKTGQPGTSSDAATTFMDRVQHKIEQTSPGEAGALLVGEDFAYTRSRNIAFALTDPAAGESVMECSFISKTISGGKLQFAAGNSQLQENSTDRVAPASSSVYVCGNETLSRHTFDAGTSSQISVTITFVPSGIVHNAWLNYMAINYPRHLRVPQSGSLDFWSDERELRLSNAPEGTIVWDVTDPGNITEINAGRTDGNILQWRPSYHTLRSYAAWSPEGMLPEPAARGFVASQNLHASESPDMVIIAPQQYAAAAESLAAIHRSGPEPMNVVVVSPEQIYNEFSSGSADPAGIRKYLKMLYDRGKAAMGNPLRYVVLMARMTFDNRHLTAAMQRGSYPTIPGWMPRTVRSSLSENEGFCTDDFIAMLEDNSGNNMGIDDISVSVGRIPATSAADARNIVDKISQYVRDSRKTAWKHRFMFLADDQDNGTHLDDTEKLIAGITATPGQQHLIRKVYMDAYTKMGNKYPEARELMFRNLHEGVVWWNFIGHANETGWTGDGQLSYTDLNNMYLRHWPFIYAATCDFLRLDASSISGAEILFFERFGGAIGVISATRPVYISDNGLLSQAIGRALAQRDSEGRFLTPGDVYRRAKNNILNNKGEKVSNTNRLRYVFMGDPALRLAIPDNIVTVDKIHGQDVDPSDPPVIAALENCEIRGRVTDPSGNTLTGFNGVLMVEIYDAERSVTTNGNGENGVKSIFEDYGERIYTGSAQVTAGEYTMTVPMPAETAQNYRPATMSLYAYSDGGGDSQQEAVGLDRNFYVYGYSEPETPDTTPPVISSLVLNHSSFENGGTVNTTPMIIAEISDDRGLNVSSAGIGHQMTAMIDGKDSYSDVSLYFTPSADGSPSGVINYTLGELTRGAHTLMLRIWDTSGNSTTREIEFFVEPGIMPKIYDVYSDANPASTVANFYLSHDQPESDVTVTITVYNLLGKPLWSSRASGRSDMFLTVPVSWDLTDNSGRRVPRGIYIYRAEISNGGDKFETASRRIAVTAE